MGLGVASASECYCGDCKHPSSWTTSAPGPSLVCPTTSPPPTTTKRVTTIPAEFTKKTTPQIRTIIPNSDCVDGNGGTPCPTTTSLPVLDLDGFNTDSTII